MYREGPKQIRLVEFSANFVEPDWCARGHVGFVLEDTPDVDFDGRVVSCPQGACIFIAAGQSNGHKARSLTSFVRLVLVEDV